MRTEPARASPESGPDGRTAVGHALLRIDPELRQGLLYCAKVFLGVRLALFAIGLAGVALLPDFSHVSAATRATLPLVPTPVSVPGWPAHGLTPGWHNVFTAWERLDGLWFLRIAASGYRTTDASAAFFPLYPLAIRGVSWLIGGHPFAAALLVSNGAFLGALLMLFVLTRTELSDEAARKAVLYAAVFPTALFFFAPYSESPFLLLVLVSFWGARRRRWAVAGAAGALAALTRNLGVLLAPALAVEAIHQALAGRRRTVPVAGLAASAGPIVGLAGYLGYWRLRSGDWLAPLHQQANWQRHLTNPLLTIGRGTRQAFQFLGVYAGGYHLLDWLIAAAALALGALALVRFRPAYGLFVAASLLVPLGSVFPGRTLIAYSRYVLPIFPLYWALARLTERSRVRQELAVAVSAALLGLMTLLFVNWYYVI